MACLLTAICSFLASVAFMLVVQRPLFMLWGRHGRGALRRADVLAVYRHGAETDLIAAAYLTVVPLLTLWVRADVAWPAWWALLGITAVAALAVGLLTVADAGLYRFWHFKIDASVLSYLRHPRAAFASVSAGYIAGAILAVMAVAGAYMALLMWVYSLWLPALGDPHWGAELVWTNVLFLLALAGLAVIIRGLRRRPNNPTIACFSHRPFLNHAAINPIFSFVYSLGEGGDPYQGRHQQGVSEADLSEAESLYPTRGRTLTRLLTTTRPNIIVIVWESLTSELMPWLPCLQQAAKEGVTFSSVDCGSFLTDRGLACIFSGLPGQPDASIGKFTRKLPNLSAWPRRLRDELGYDTAVIHGGDLSVRQKADYYLASGHTTLIAQGAMPRSAPRCKWGVHDEATFTRLYDEAVERGRRGTPFMLTLQTLSSHEPFIVPSAIVEGNAMANAFAYTDACLGRLLAALKRTHFWDDTLVVVTGDHGVHFAGDYGVALPRDRFVRIPLVLTGGAVASPCRIDTLMSQTDIAATLLGQMGLDHSEFPFSRDVLADSYPAEPVTFQASHHDVFLRDTSGWTLLDTDTGTATHSPGQDGNTTRQRRARAILARLYRYLAQL